MIFPLKFSTRLISIPVETEVPISAQFSRSKFEMNLHLMTRRLSYARNLWRLNDMLAQNSNNLIKSQRHLVKTDVISIDSFL